MMDYIDYNPYNGNVITKNDSFQLKQENPYENKNWIFGNSMRNSYDTKKINYNSFNQNGRNIIENRKDNNILNLQKNQIYRNYNENQFRNNNLQTNPNINNIRYLIYIPVQIPQNQNINIYNSPQLFQNNKLNFQSNKSIQNDPNDNFPFGSESKRKEEERQIKMQQYREELLKQIAEKKRADEERKRKMKEEEKNDIKKNEEYFRLKKQQADEQARKLKEKIARRMQEQQLEELGNFSNILEISKDFENMNKSRQGSSLVNNIEFNKSKKSFKNANLNNYTNYNENGNIFSFVHNDMILEQENYMKEIDNDYNELYQTIKFDIDQMINDNKNEDLNLDIQEYNEQLEKKEKQFADYMLSKTLNPPTPFKFDKNPLIYSYQPKMKDNNKISDLEDFFNKDKENDYYLEERPLYRKSEIRNQTNKEYFNIFESLNDAKAYTKKYSSEKEISHSETLISNLEYSSKDENNSNNETKNRFDIASYYNSTISNSMYERENNKKENDEDNAIKIEDSSMGTTENKNKSKTLLDKKLINIKENKEDEEDEEEDEENKKLKEEKHDKNENKKEDNLENQNLDDKDKEDLKNNENNLNEEKEQENEEEEDDSNEKDNIK